MLRLERLSKAFGGLSAVAGVTTRFARGSVTALIGPNGAGKTTIFNLVTGLVAPSSGHVFQDEVEITGLKPFEVARRGIGRTFQHTRIFQDLTAAENVVIARPQVRPALGAALALSRAERRRWSEEAAGYLDLVGLAGLAGRPGGDLAYAEQKLVMLACLIASGARTLLLDEPTAGLDPPSRRRIVETVEKLASPQSTIVLVEHNLDVVRGLARHVVFLAEGAVVAEGTPAEIERDERLVALYFGSGHARG